MQFFRGDEDEQKFFLLGKDLFNRTIEDLKAYIANAYRSPKLGEAIYKAAAMTIYKTLAIDDFKRAYWQFLEAQTRLGSINGYLDLLYSVFGKDADITITKTKKHLHFEITAKVIVRKQWKTQQGERVLTKDNRQIYFKGVKTPLSGRDLLSLLQHASLQGTLITYTINGV